MKRILLFFLFLCLSLNLLSAAEHLFQIRGRIIDKQTREPVSFANVILETDPTKGSATDEKGDFSITEVKPGIYRLVASCIGYKNCVTPEYIVSANTPFVEIEMEAEQTQLDEVTVRPVLFQKLAESPVSLQVIGLQEIEKSPGANRDISRIVQAYPGVTFSPAGYRNDLIVRGGSPSENRFYLDGIEIPNINHFSTQGASGGPVGIINADLIREINFYTGAFPSDKGNALSSVLDFRLRDGNMENNRFKATLGASEVSLSGNGHFNDKVSYLVSVRQSYLQLLFNVLGLPLLPNYIDGQFKIKARFSPTDELTVLGLTGIDRMKLNLDLTGEDAEYILSYLPVIEQETFTLGAMYRHYAGKHTQSLSVSHNFLRNKNTKYLNNDESSEDNLMLRLRSTEQKTVIKGENKSYLGAWTVKEGAEINYIQYQNTSFQRMYGDQLYMSNYDTDLGLWSWGAFATAEYTTPDNRFKSALGVRLDGNNFSKEMKQIWKNISPRLSLSYAFTDNWSLSGSSGLYNQLPPYTALGFKDENVLINENLKYMQVAQGNIGLNWKTRNQLSISLEGFYKKYFHVPLSVNDQIPLLCKGNDYGVIGNEPLVSTAEGQSYGLELMGKWQILNRLNLVSSFTLYRSEYRNNKESEYIPSAWDNRFIFNTSGTYNFPKNWSFGAKLSCIGGAPYTPYDADKSSLVQAWNAQGRPYYDYSRYNSERLAGYAQLDIRIDKMFYFKRYMLGIYLDLQNVTMSKLKQQDILMSTGVIENPEAPIEAQRYVMKSIKQESGTLLPTLGVTFEF